MFCVLVNIPPNLTKQPHIIMLLGGDARTLKRFCLSPLLYLSHGMCVCDCVCARVGASGGIPHHVKLKGLLGDYSCQH